MAEEESPSGQGLAPEPKDGLSAFWEDFEKTTSFLEAQAEAEKALVAAQDKALKEKNLLPEGFTSSVAYTARVQPEDPNIDTEEKVRLRFQTRRFPGHEIQIVWDFKFDPETQALVSNVGDYAYAPNQNGVTREGIILIGPKSEGDGLPMMVFGE